MTQPIIACIAGGLGGIVLLAGKGAAYLVRRSAVAKRAANTEAFALKVLPSLNQAGIRNV